MKQYYWGIAAFDSPLSWENKWPLHQEPLNWSDEIWYDLIDGDFFAVISLGLLFFLYGAYICLHWSLNGGSKAAYSLSTREPETVAVEMKGVSTMDSASCAVWPRGLQIDLGSRSENPSICGEDKVGEKEDRKGKQNGNRFREEGRKVVFRFLISWLEMKGQFHRHWLRIVLG